MESVPDALIVAKATPLIDQSMRADALTDSAPSIAQLETPLTEVSILPSGLTQVLDPKPALPEIIETKVVQIDGAKMALPLGIAEVTTDLSNDVAAAVNAAPAAATVIEPPLALASLKADLIAADQGDIELALVETEAKDEKDEEAALSVRDRKSVV